MDIQTEISDGQTGRQRCIKQTNGQKSRHYTDGEKAGEYKRFCYTEKRRRRSDTGIELEKTIKVRKLTMRFHLETC